MTAVRLLHRRQGGRRRGDAHHAAAILCAVNDALVPLGVTLLEVPASPQRIWTLLQQVKRSA